MIKLKRVTILTVVLSMMLMSGCASNNGENNDSKAADFGDSPITTSISHGSPSGLWFMLSSGISESVSRSYKGSLVQTTPGQSYTNFIRMNEASIEFGLTLSNIAFSGLHGIDQFEEKHEGVGGVAILYPSMFQMVIKENLGITTFTEFIEKKVPVRLSIGALNSSAEQTFTYMLEEYGLTVEDLEAWGCKLTRKSLKDTGELFADGALDGLWLVAGSPTPVIVQMGTNTDMIMLKFTPEKVKAMIDKHGFGNYTLPGGSYSFESEDYVTFCSYTMLAVSLEVSDETVYKVTKSINENVEYLSTIHSALAGLTIEKLVNGMAVPMHPGAEKYYREIGVID